MPTPMTFALHFSGHDLREQQRQARERLHHTPAEEHAVRAQLLAVLAAACVFTDAPAAAEAAEQAAAEAHLADDDVARAWSLLAACVVDLSCETTPERLAMSREVLRLARGRAEQSLVSAAYFLHLAALAELAETAQLDQALSPVGPLLTAFPWLECGRHAAWFRCLRATLDGHVDTAEQLTHSAYAVALQSSDPDAQSVRVGQLAIIRWMQGRVVELEPAFLQARQAAPHEPVWAVSLAWMWLRQGRKSAARALLATLPPARELPTDRNWLSTACILATVAAELAERTLARDLHALLLPFEGRLATIGLGVTCWGTVSRPLALLAAALGDTDAAVAHYRRAIDLAARTGAHPWLAEAQGELARTLATRSAPGDREEALSLATEAAATGRALQLPGIEGTATTVLADLQPPAPGAVPTSPSRGRERQPRIVVLGDFSVTGANGALAHWQSRKARQLVKILVARRGVAVSRETVMHLLWPGESAQRVANRFSVATAVARRALDPEGTGSKDAYLESRSGLIRLRVDEVEIDVERFLGRTNAALAFSGPPEAQRMLLADALAGFRGEPLSDEPEELWAAELRREVHIAFFAAAHALAEQSGSAGDHLARVDAYRRILTLDDYDQRAHEGLIDALGALGAHGQAAQARDHYAQRMRELGISARE